MKRLLLSVLIVLFSYGGLSAQRRGGRGLVDRSHESLSYLVVSIGPEYCYSDTQGDLWYQMSFKNNDMSIGYRTTYSNNLGYKVTFNNSNFTGNDTGSKYARRYSYSSNVMQLSLQGEYSLKIGRHYYYRPTPNSIYGFAGAGMLRSNANLYIGSDYRDNYIYRSKNISPYIPFDISPFVHFGLGYQYNFNNNFVIGAEFNFKYAFSDYIDGFKPPTIDLNNGTKMVSKSNDVFGGISFTVSYLLGSAYLKRN
ncbi:MAG: DUF6089 family protein [Paludibacter sp.]|nr:DUF6089 family protein [Paludibacter sp.]